MAGQPRRETHFVRPGRVRPGCRGRDPMGGITEAPPEPLAPAGPATGNAFIALGRTGRSSFWITLLVFAAEAIAFLVVSVVAGVIVFLTAGKPLTSIDQLPPLEVLIVAAL